MAKTTATSESGVFESNLSNGTQPVIKTVAKNADGSSVKDPRK